MPPSARPFDDPPGDPPRSVPFRRLYRLLPGNLQVMVGVYPLMFVIAAVLVALGQGRYAVGILLVVAAVLPIYGWMFESFRRKVRQYEPAVGVVEGIEGEDPIFGFSNDKMIRYRYVVGGRTYHDSHLTCDPRGLAAGDAIWVLVDPRRPSQSVPWFGGRVVQRPSPPPREQPIAPAPLSRRKAAAPVRREGNPLRRLWGGLLGTVSRAADFFDWVDTLSEELPYSREPRMPVSLKEADRVYRNYDGRNGYWYEKADMVLDDGTYLCGVTLNALSHIVVEIDGKPVAEQPRYIDRRTTAFLVFHSAVWDEKHPKVSEDERRAFRDAHRPKRVEAEGGP